MNFLFLLEFEDLIYIPLKIIGHGIDFRLATAIPAAAFPKAMEIVTSPGVIDQQQTNHTPANIGAKFQKTVIICFIDDFGIKIVSGHDNQQYINQRQKKIQPDAPNDCREAELTQFAGRAFDLRFIDYLDWGCGHDVAPEYPSRNGIFLAPDFCYRFFVILEIVLTMPAEPKTL
jgi:hypothetical protein